MCRNATERVEFQTASFADQSDAATTKHRHQSLAVGCADGSIILQRIEQAESQLRCNPGGILEAAATRNYPSKLKEQHKIRQCHGQALQGHVAIVMAAACCSHLCAPIVMVRYHSAAPGICN